MCHILSFILFVFFQRLSLELVGSVLGGLSQSQRREGSCFIHPSISRAKKITGSRVGAISKNDLSSEEGKLFYSKS